MKWLKTIKDAISASILCIRFPFLYPRNRFSGNHYNSWKLLNFHRKWYKHTVDTFFIHIATEIPENLKYLGNFDDRSYRIEVKDSIVRLINNNTKEVFYTRELSKFGKGEVLKTGWVDKTPYLIVSKDWEESKDLNRFVKYVHARWLYNIVMILDWINDYPLQIFHCIPTYTELDAMDYGWRKAFGIQMCKEIKAALKKSNYLYKYRITQIKEKFGGLRWYDAGAPNEVFDIIQKYSEISYRTCINCGKPATKISTGWICPYCDDCADPKGTYKDINESW